MLLLYFFFACITNRGYRTQVVNNNIFKLSITLYIVGLLSTLIYPTTNPDTIYFARKAAFLLTIPCLFMLTMKQDNKELAIRALIAGFTVAVIFALYHTLNLSSWHGQRVTSFFDVGRWSEVLTYFLVFTLPLALNNKESQKKRILFAGLLLLGYICLILSGSRGAMLTTLVVSLLFLLMANRTAFYRVAVTSLIILPLLVVIFPSKTNIIQDRIASITNTTTDESNSARLNMWHTGTLFAKDNLAHNPLAFFFGSGPLNFEQEFKTFTMGLNHGEDITQKQVFSYTDTHNGIIDVTLKLGIIYETLFILLITLIAINILRGNQKFKYSGLCVITAFFTIGMFYTNQLEYQTICFFYFLSIALPHSQEHQNA